MRYLRDLKHRSPIVWVDNNRLAKLLLFSVIGKLLQLFFKKNAFSFAHIKKSITFALAIEKQTIAQMAESVDALVSNTSGATHPGSIPGLGTTEKVKRLSPFPFYIHTTPIGVTWAQ